MRGTVPCSAGEKPFDSRGCSHSPSSDLYHDERAAEERCLKKRAVSSLPLYSLWLVFQNSQMLAKEGWSEGICASAVWYLLSCEKSMFQMSDLSGFLACNFLPFAFFPPLFSPLSLVYLVHLSTLLALTISQLCFPPGRPSCQCSRS